MPTINHINIDVMKKFIIVLSALFMAFGLNSCDFGNSLDDNEELPGGGTDDGTGSTSGKKVKSIVKTYALTIGSALLEAADITIHYIDANNKEQSEKLTSKTWYKAFTCVKTATQMAFNIVCQPGSHTKATVIDDNQNYDVSAELEMVYEVVYEDGTKERLPLFNINPSTQQVPGQYLDPAINAIAMTVQQAVEYDEEEGTVERTDYWKNNDNAYVPNGDFSGENQVVPVLIGGSKDIEWVDMGAGSKVLWATCNVGADSPTEPGGLYGWGDATGFQTSTNYYYYPTFFAKAMGYVNIASTQHDIATVQWGRECHLPSSDDWKWLKENCELPQRAVNGGTTGFWLTSKINGNKIFLPTAERRYGNNNPKLSTMPYGYYWTSDLNQSDDQFAYASYFSGMGNFYVPGMSGASVERFYGCSVRPVKNK